MPHAADGSLRDEVERLRDEVAALRASLAATACAPAAPGVGVGSDVTAAAVAHQGPPRASALRATPFDDDDVGAPWATDEYVEWRETLRGIHAVQTGAAQPVVAVSYHAQGKDRMEAVGRFCCDGDGRPGASACACACACACGPTGPVLYHSGVPVASRTSRHQAKKGKLIAFWSCCERPAVEPQGEPLKYKFFPESHNGCCVSSGPAEHRVPRATRACEPSGDDDENNNNHNNNNNVLYFP